MEAVVSIFKEIKINLLWKEKQSHLHRHHLPLYYTHLPTLLTLLIAALGNNNLFL